MGVSFIVPYYKAKDGDDLAESLNAAQKNFAKLYNLLSAELPKIGVNNHYSFDILHCHRYRQKAVTDWGYVFPGVIFLGSIFRGLRDEDKVG